MLAVTSPRVLLLDNNTGKWVDGPPLGHARGAGGAAVVGDKIIVVGGRTGNPEQLVTQTEVYDGTSWRDAGDIPVPGDHLAVAADSSYLYAVGGCKFSASSNTDVVQCYDPKANRWTALTPTPQPVGGAGAAIVNGQLIVVGGETPTSVSGTVQAYDVSAPNATWTTLASLDPGRHGLGVTPSATPSTPSAEPRKPETPHPPNSSEHSPSRNGPAIDPETSWTPSTASSLELETLSRHRLRGTRSPGPTALRGPARPRPRRALPARRGAGGRATPATMHPVLRGRSAQAALVHTVRRGFPDLASESGWTWRSELCRT